MDAAVTTLKFENKAVIPTDPRTKLFLTVTVSTITSNRYHLLLCPQKESSG